MNNAGMNICASVCVEIVFFIFLGYLPGSGLPGPMATLTHFEGLPNCFSKVAFCIFTSHV